MNADLSKLTENYSQKEAELIAKAFDFAKSAHKGQKRESGEDYFIHPYMTALKLADLKLDGIAIAAALLHDVVDDTEIEQSQIKKAFGGEIANLVEGISKLGKAKYQGIERFAENLRKFFLAMSKDLRVVLIKLADRTHNMETIKYLPGNKQKRIAKETLEIYAPIANRLGMGQVKGELEDLAFPIAYPEEYEKTLKIYNTKKETQSQYIQTAKKILIKKLVKNNVPLEEVNGRIKHTYSFFKKLSKHDGNADLIFDIIAIRILVKNIRDCYNALGVVHNIWRPLPNRIKDFVALPKPNGYKSIHTTVLGSDNIILEIQIRTLEMHQEAEFGIASHWIYDESKNTKNYQRKKTKIPKAGEISWVQQLAELQNNQTSTNEFLSDLKLDFFNNRIFVLTPKGDVLDLPEGATPLDFAFKIHSDIGCKCIAAKANKKIIPLNYSLQNGEVIEIITRDNITPKRKWLAIVQTNEAKHKIRTALKRLKT